MALSNRTLALLAAAFEGGSGPSHSTIDLVWTAADASDYLGEGNKLDRVLYGLRYLRDGRPGSPTSPTLPPDHVKLQAVTADLATRLMAVGLVDVDRLEVVLANDGFSLEGDHLADTRPIDEPADRIAAYVDELFGDRPDLSVARNHYAQANRAFDRGDWEAANAQFRSAFDATYDALSATKGCSPSKKGGEARKWLSSQGLIEADEAELLRAFSTFAGRAGSHAGLSDATDCQLRRHFAAALISFGITKLG